MFVVGRNSFLNTVKFVCLQNAKSEPGGNAEILNWILSSNSWPRQFSIRMTGKESFCPVEIPGTI